MTDFKTACAIVRQMIKGFESLSDDDKIAMYIVTIHQDDGFECLLPEEWKLHLVIKNYYESRWKRVYRVEATRKYCSRADTFIKKWHELFAKYKRELEGPQRTRKRSRPHE